MQLFRLTFSAIGEIEETFVHHGSSSTHEGATLTPALQHQGILSDASHGIRRAVRRGI